MKMMDFGVRKREDRNGFRERDIRFAERKEEDE